MILKYSVLAVILSVLIGVTIGASFVNYKAQKQLDHERELVRKKIKHDNDSLLTLILHRELIILKLDDRRKQDSVQINGLLFKIKEDGDKTDKKRQIASKFNKNEKVKFILDRYSN